MCLAGRENKRKTFMEEREEGEKEERRMPGASHTASHRVNRKDV